MSPPSVPELLRPSAGRPRLIVSRAALLDNLRRLRQAAGLATKFCAVVKADAYGHGAAAVVDALFAAYANDLPTPAVDFLAVATIGEALELPDHDVPIMVLRPVECVYLGHNRGDLEAALRRNIVLSLVSTAAVDDVARLAEKLGLRANVQVMLDTGMNREMCEPRHFASVVNAVVNRPALRLVGTGTHFTDGELGDDEPYNDEQSRLLHEAIAPLPAASAASVLRHVANSGGILTGGEEGEFEMVRGGLALYGIHPACTPGADVAGLRPIARWTAPLLLVRDVPVGGSVGYGRTWRATRPTRVGVLPIGYADGYPRLLSDKSVVRVPNPDGDDAFCPVVGRVSMDYITIDLTNAPWAIVGDEVVLLDDRPGSPCDATTLAVAAGTIPYELLCGIGRRIPRVYVD